MLILGSKSQANLFRDDELPPVAVPFRTQLLKWIGNKQKQADAIIAYFPKDFGTFYEPFLGSGGVLGVLAPKRAVASDAFGPLIEIWQTLHDDKELLKQQYADRYALVAKWGKVNATIPKSLSPDTLTVEDAVELIAEREGRPAKPARKAAAPKKTAAPKKAAAKPATKPAAKPAAKPPAAKGRGAA